MAVETTQGVNGARATDTPGAVQLAQTDAKNRAEQFSEMLRQAGADGQIDSSERNELFQALKDMPASIEQAFRQVVGDRVDADSRDRTELRAFFDLASTYQTQFANWVADQATGREQTAVIEALAPAASDSEAAAQGMGHIVLNMPDAHVRDAVDALSAEGVLDSVFAAATEEGEQRSGYYSVERPLVSQEDFDDLVRTMALATDGEGTGGLYADVFESATEVFSNYQGSLFQDFNNEDKLDTMGALHGMLMSHGGAGLDESTSRTFSSDSIKDLFEIAIKELDGSGVVAQGSGLMIASSLAQMREPLDAFAQTLVDGAEAGDGAKIDALQNAFAWDGTNASQEQIADQLEAAGADPAFASIANDAAILERLQGLLLDAAGRASEDRGDLSSAVVNIFGGTFYGSLAVAPFGGKTTGAVSPFLADAASDIIRGQLSPESAGALENIPQGEDWQPESFLDIVRTLGQPQLQREDGTNIPVQEGEIDVPGADPDSGTQPADIAANIIENLRQRFYHQYDGRSL